jgi:hypothetical protein
VTAFGPLLDGLDLHEDLVDYERAAEIAGVPVATVRQWKSRQHLRPAGLDGRRPLFRPIDVLRAEAATRHPARRRFPQAG